ncbi:MAG: phosphoribosylaminoimidazolesuccinocarboxamide synthase [Candidatus Geothermincolia bacterium]
MNKKELLYEGKAKRVYLTDEPGIVIHDYKDSATAFDGKKRGEIKGKGVVNARMTALIFDYLEGHGIKTHMVKVLSETELVTHHLQMLKVELIVRNVAAGSLANRIGYPEGQALRKPLVEYYLKDDALGDPMLAPAHIEELELLTSEQLRRVTEIGLAVNEAMIPFFAEIGLKLIDFKLEFGLQDGEVILADEFSPDTSRLWDADTDEKMDKDRFRRDLGNVEETYAEVMRRVEERWGG